MSALDWLGLLIFGLLCLLFGGRRVLGYYCSAYYRATRVPYWTLRSDKGKAGEYEVYRKLRALRGYKKFLLNCYLPRTDGATTEIDVILLHSSGIHVFESKNYKGFIYGSGLRTEWSQTLFRGQNKVKNSFLNPMLQNELHIRCLKQFLWKYPQMRYFSYIVFEDQCTLNSITLVNTAHQVLKRRELLRAVRKNAKKSSTKLDRETIDALYAQLYPLTQVSEKEKQQHIEHIEQRKNVRVFQPRVQRKRCPECGGELVLRTASRGKYRGESFYGCSNYPRCRYIQSVERKA